MVLLAEIWLQHRNECMVSFGTPMHANTLALRLVFGLRCEKWESQGCEASGSERGTSEGRSGSDKHARCVQKGSKAKPGS